MQNDLQAEISKINPILKKFGMCEMAVVNPKDCKPQSLNARYMPSEMFTQLRENIQNDGRLESIPLCYKDEKDSIRIISGHHRIKACEELNIEQILVLITVADNREKVISKQLSHNSITGLDDAQILQNLFDEIKTVDAKMYSGISSELEKIKYQTINFRIGSFQEFLLSFLPEDIEKYDEVMEEMAQDSKARPSTAAVRLVSKQSWGKYSKTLQEVKRVENIKNNGVAFMRML